MSALGGIYAALKTLIGSDATTAALLGKEPFAGAGVNGKGVYDEGAAPQAAVFPFVTVGAGTEVPFTTHGSRGWNCTVQIKVIGQGSEAAGLAIVAALSDLLFPLPRRRLTVAGYSDTWVDDFSVVPSLTETVAGVATKSWPVIVRVIAT